MSKVKFLAAVVFILLSIIPLCINGVVFGRSNTADIPEAPRLVYPIDPETSIAGRTLEFKWQHADIGIDRYEFMLYKGGGSSGDVIVEKTLPFNVSFLEVDAGSFENGQVYTWTLRQIGDNGSRSEKSFATFRIIKK